MINIAESTMTMTMTMTGKTRYKVGLLNSICTGIFEGLVLEPARVNIPKIYLYYKGWCLSADTRMFQH